ncbi:MAG TPA: DUF5698 domain-containing protein [Acidobacteriota bacterium]|jgi:uncharacterized protein YebE (UPF0316 family)|nr:DUF5698 domain-containing protein [Acidobacteriota bacterium]HNT17918.1 DUF5698 domain-containing protein [Acidobacteriota bacterium]HPA27405.1 DUF5698 domain-containing protein [Acidobacteriota bacterium]HQO18884.1 DUF5698 domain-containing protein [Acidobacteriota bacterium]HQQ46747.1 DUF5698 domain-containing protein [Acidobacteriota bacterium]
MNLFENTDLFGYVILPLLIFCARIFDQSLGIMRIIFATKGFILLTFVCAIFESFIWLLAIRQIMGQMDNVFYYVVFAAGFATGNVVGLFIEKRLSIGFVMVRVVFQKNSDESVRILKEKGYRLTSVDALGVEGPVRMIFSTIRRGQAADFIRTLKINNPTGFYTIEDVRQVKEGYIPGMKKQSSLK